jgi:hypothetical protein
MPTATEYKFFNGSAFSLTASEWSTRGYNPTDFDQSAELTEAQAAYVYWNLYAIDCTANGGEKTASGTTPTSASCPLTTQTPVDRILNFWIGNAPDFLQNSDSSGNTFVRFYTNGYINANSGFTSFGFEELLRAQAQFVDTTGSGSPVGDITTINLKLASFMDEQTDTSSTTYTYSTVNLSSPIGNIPFIQEEAVTVIGTLQTGASITTPSFEFYTYS